MLSARPLRTDSRRGEENNYGAAPFGSRMSGSWISRLAPCAAVGSGESARCGRRTRRPRRTAARPPPLARISCGLAAAPRSVAGPRVTARALVACGSGSRQPRSLRWCACLSLTQAGDLPAIAREPGQVTAQRSSAHRFICLFCLRLQIADRIVGESLSLNFRLIVNQPCPVANPRRARRLAAPA